MGTTMGKTTASNKPVLKRGKSKIKSQHQFQKTYQEKFSDDIIMIDDDDNNDDDLASSLASSKLENGTEDIADTSVSLDQSENVVEKSSTTDCTISDDEEIEVIKANIFKYQGELSYEQEVDRDILNFKYYDDFVVIEDDVPNDDFESFEDEATVEEEPILVTCDECQKLFDTGNVDEHKREKHPPKKKSIKRFDGGNFFIIAT